jgi:hypothetical protein
VANFKGVRFLKKAIAVELQKIRLEPDDCLFVKVDLNTFDIEEAVRICEMVKELVPKDIAVIGYPGPAIELQVVRKL